MVKSAMAAALALALGACAAGPSPRSQAAPIAAVPVPQSLAVPGIVGRTARQLSAWFGAPSSQLAEGTARKLQFAGPLCVLDAYLYPPAPGGDPAVTHVDARRPTGEDYDRASCIAALRLR